MAAALDIDSVIERLLAVRGQQTNRTVQLAEGEIRALCAAARCARKPAVKPDLARSGLGVHLRLGAPRSRAQCCA